MHPVAGLLEAAATYAGIDTEQFSIKLKPHLQVDRFHKTSGHSRHGIVWIFHILFFHSRTDIFTDTHKLVPPCDARRREKVGALHGTVSGLLPLLLNWSKSIIIYMYILYIMGFMCVRIQFMHIRVSHQGMHK